MPIVSFVWYIPICNILFVCDVDIKFVPMLLIVFTWLFYGSCDYARDFI